MNIFYLKYFSPKIDKQLFTVILTIKSFITKKLVVFFWFSFLHIVRRKSYKLSLCKFWANVTEVTFHRNRSGSFGSQKAQRQQIKHFLESKRHKCNLLKIVCNLRGRGANGSQATLNCTCIALGFYTHRKITFSEKIVDILS